MTASETVTGCPKVDLENPSNSGGTELLSATTAVAESAAVALACDSSQQGEAIDVKSASTWLGFCHGLTKAPCLASPTATPLSEPSLSEVSSSHGGLTPRGTAPERHGRPSPLRWADETEADADCLGGLDTSEIQDDDDQDDGAAEQGNCPTTPSKRSRRSNRRRRARAEKAAAAQNGLLLGGVVQGAKKELGVLSFAKGNGGIRNSVTVSDLFGASPNQARSGRSPLASASPGQDEVGWFMPVSPCRAQAGPRGIMSTSPCAGGNGGAPAGRMTFGFDSSGYVTGCSPSAANQAMFAMPMTDGANVWASNSPMSPYTTHNGLHATTPGGLSTSPTAGMEASARSPPPLPVGPVASAPLGSPCQTRANSMFSTSPTSGDHSAPKVMQCAIGSEAGGYPANPAGSPTADALRSWIQASQGGLSCADLAYQLRAAAPEAYED